MSVTFEFMSQRMASSCHSMNQMNLLRQNRHTRTTKFQIQK